MAEAKKQYKGSYFEKLVPARKDLFEKFPIKGLALTGHALKFGDKSQYTFTFETGGGDKIDKLEVKGPIEITARNKKTKDDWEIAFKKDDMGCKYEHKQGSPDYAVSYEYAKKGQPYKLHMKYHPLTYLTKASCFFSQKDFTAVADCKFIGTKLMEDPKSIAFNTAVAYASPVGTSALTYTSKGTMVLGHFFKPMMEKKLTAGVEVVLTGGGKEANVDLACNYKIDSDHDLKAKASAKGVLEVCLKKTFTSHCVLSVGTLIDSKTLSKMSAPALGFKLAMKP